MSTLSWNGTVVYRLSAHAGRLSRCSPSHDMNALELTLTESGGMYWGAPTSPNGNISPTWHFAKRPR
eukprot:1583161-Pyramimonas_sp.AAC.1